MASFSPARAPASPTPFCSSPNGAANDQTTPPPDWNSNGTHWVGGLCWPFFGGYPFPAWRGQTKGNPRNSHVGVSFLGDPSKMERGSSWIPLRTPKETGNCRPKNKTSLPFFGGRNTPSRLELVHQVRLHRRLHGEGGVPCHATIVALDFHAILGSQNRILARARAK